jgi:hypothetical protein
MIAEGIGPRCEFWLNQSTEEKEMTGFHVRTPHAGPYLGRLRAGKTLWILFGPRLPEGVQIDAPDLSRVRNDHAFGRLG